MRNKVLALRKIDEIGNIVKRLDLVYNGVGTPYEKEQVYLSVKEKLEELETLINTEFDE